VEPDSILAGLEFAFYCFEQAVESLFALLSPSPNENNQKE